MDNLFRAMPHTGCKRGMGPGFQNKKVTSAALLQRLLRRPDNPRQRFQSCRRPPLWQIRGSAAFWPARAGGTSCRSRPHGCRQTR